jgi:hypothetical protein
VTTIRLTALSLAILAATTTAQGATAAADPPKGDPVPFETLAVVSGTTGINLTDAQILRLTSTPPGSADGAALVHFGFLGSHHPGGPTAVELTDDGGALSAMLGPEADVPALSDPPPGVRRLAFVRPGCQYDTAELWVTQRLVTPHFEHDDPDLVINCAVAEFYLAVFDVPADRLPPTAELDDSIVG